MGKPYADTEELVLADKLKVYRFTEVTRVFTFFIDSFLYVIV